MSARGTAVFNLCRKDLLAAHRPLLLILVIFILYFLQPVWSSLLIMAVGGVFGFLCLFVIFFLEDRNKTEILYLSLPQKRSTIVGARYFLAGLLSLIGGAILFGFVVPLHGLIFSSRPLGSNLQSLLSVEGMAGYLVISAFISALYLPFHHRFGFGRGVILFQIVGVALLAGVAGGMKLVGRAFDFVDFWNDPKNIKDPGAGILDLIGAIRTSLGTTLFLITIVVFVIIATAISLWLSLRFYDRREF
jgi:hypothetical protein